MISEKLPSTRKEAIQLGLTQYFTGQPCKRGHVAKRYVNDKRCTYCNAIRMRDRRQRRKLEINRRERERYRQNPHRIKMESSTRRASKKHATPPWADKSAILEVYKNCPVGMEVDHIIPLRGKNVCGLHVPWNLQYLTPFENRSKNNIFLDFMEI